MSYDLSDSFDIDDDQLDGLTLEQAFVLGVEWEMVRAQLEGGAEIDRPIHSRNATRIKAMVERRERAATFIQPADGWVRIRVAPRTHPEPEHSQ